MLFGVVSVQAQSFEVDGISYNVTKEATDGSPGEVEVTGGEIKEVIEIPETVTYDDVTYTVTAIGNNAFSGRYTKKYVIPSTVRAIGDHAFYDNYYLEEVEFHEGLQSIGAAAFAFNYALKEIRLPSTLSTIDDSGFLTNQNSNIAVYCTAAAPPNIHSTAFQGRTNGPLHVTNVDVEAYKEAENWKDFSEIVGDMLYRQRCYYPIFNNDNNLLTMSCKTEGATIYYTTDGTIPDENAHRYTSPIPFTNTQIIRAIAIAESFENSAVRDFYDMEYIESITNVIDEQGVYYTFKQAVNDSYYYSVTGHSDVLNSEIVIPDDINGYAVKAIENNVFSGCSGLLSVDIPGTLTSIGTRAFEGCYGLKKIVSGISTPFVLDNVFSNFDATLVVPQGSSADYKSVGGWEFAFTFEEGEVFDREYTDTQGVIYTLKVADDDSFYYSVTGHADVVIAEIFIPEELNGCPVKTIKDGFKDRAGQWDHYYVYHSVFSDCPNLVSITIPNNITLIGDCAFAGCSSLVSVALGNQLTTIGDDAFGSCTSLSSIVIPNSVKIIGARAFGKCSNLTSVILGSDLETIGDHAFNDCVNLSSIIIPNSVTNIGEFAFYNCSGLTSITIGNGITSLKAGTFYGCSGLTAITIPNSLTSIENASYWYSYVYGLSGSGEYGVFANCSGLTSVKMGKNVNRIGEYAFAGCTNLTSITLPDVLDSISAGSFRSTALTSIEIPSGVKKIGNYAFCNTNLISINIPDGVTSIGSGAFSYCDFTSVTIPNTVETIGEEAFSFNENLVTAIIGDGVTKIEKGLFAYCHSLSSVIIPNGVTYIGESAFASCYSLTSIRLPESLNSMGGGALSSSVKSIELPNSFTVIPEELFVNNDFQYIKLGNNVKSIGKNAFGSSELVLEIGTSTPPSITKDVFPNVEYLSDLTVIVPDSKAETAYRKAAVWEEMTFSNQNNMSEVTVDTPGDLSFELITECNMTPAKVVSLKVNGTINAEDFNQMLVNMKSLLRLDLTDCNITEIPNEALKDKAQLRELILPTSLQSVGEGAFSGCTFLSELTMQNGLQTIGRSAFQDCPNLIGELTLPSTLVNIGESAFVGTGYTSVKLPNTLKTIGDYAFHNLPIAQQLSLPAKVSSVGAHAFAGTKITGLSMTDGVTSIGDYAFADTPIQGFVWIYDGITYLGEGAFKNTQISSVFLPNSITTLSSGLFQGCQNLNQVYVPDNFTGMSSSAFDGCGSLTILRLSANLETIGEYALQNTPQEYVKIPSKVEVLSRGVLKNCKNLTSLSLPANLKSVEDEALYGCTALRNMSVEALTPPTVRGRNAIRGINTDLCLISIPTSAYRNYVLAEYWGQFVQMRNDIAVETVGDGEIAFESVVEEEEEVSESREFNPRRAARASRRAPGLATEEETKTIANNGSTIYIPQQGKVRFIITPAPGEELISATLDDEDIMPDIVDGVYIATADKKGGKLVVKFSGESQGSVVMAGDVNGDGVVDVADAVSIVNYVVGKATTEFNDKAADVNNDGDIDVSDAVRLVNFLVGKIDALSRQLNFNVLDPQ